MLVTPADLTARRISFTNETEARAKCEDVSHRVRASVAPLLAPYEATDPNQPAVTQGVPGAVVAIVVGLVRRELTNPRALTQESLGDYAYSSGGESVASGYLTKREKRLLRRALDVPVVGGLHMSTASPVPVGETYHD